jgi:hypothetical protein
MFSQKESEGAVGGPENAAVSAKPGDEKPEWEGRIGIESVARAKETVKDEGKDDRNRRRFHRENALSKNDGEEEELQVREDHHGGRCSYNRYEWYYNADDLKREGKERGLKGKA